MQRLGKYFSHTFRNCDILITSFIDELFVHYFPDVNVTNFKFIDKELISKYEALKESLKGDLFIAAEAEIEQFEFALTI